MLAIVIPYYKETFFEETLSSLVKQTNKNFNVYVGNDASPEDPKELIGKFTPLLNLYYERFEKNLGGSTLTEHWKRCIEMIGDEAWIMILGDDDYLGSEVVETFYKNKNIFEEETNVVRFATMTVDHNSAPSSKIFNHPTWESAADSFFRRFLYQTRSSLSEHVFRRKTYNRYGFYNFPLAWYSDNRAWIDFSENKPIYSINEATVYIRISKLSISGKADNSELKKEALLQFYRYLIFEKIHLFTKPQRLKLVRYFEDRLRENKMVNFKNWWIISYFYFSDYDVFKKFLKRSLKSTLEIEKYI